MNFSPLTLLENGEEGGSLYISSRFSSKYLAISRETSPSQGLSVSIVPGDEGNASLGCSLSLPQQLTTDHSTSLLLLPSVPSAASMRRKAIEAVYGVYSLIRSHYLAVVTRSELVARGPGGCSWFRVLKMEFIPIEQGAQ
ncbi:unnamed protein product, partial [Symbiodinium sp. KB8]